MPIISGTVFDASGNPVAGRIVRAYRRDTGALLAQTLTSDGISSSDPHWDNVVALLHLDGDFEDETGWLWEKQGTEATFEIIADGWDRALRFTGASGNALQASPGNEGHRLSYDNDWTVEMRVRLEGASTGTRVVLSRGRNGSTLSFWMTINLTGVGWVQSINGTGSSTESFTAPFEFTPNKWYHVAVVGRGRFRSIFVDGIKIGEKEFLKAWNNPSSADALRIGSLDYGINYSYWFIGAVDEVRVTNGVARYTEDFTPPTEPFPARKVALPLGKYEITTTYTGECNVICLDDSEGTTYNDLILRTIPA